MDEIIQRAIAHNEASKKASVPWKVDEPFSQKYFLFDIAKQAWQGQSTSTAVLSETNSGFNRLALYAWNIDFMLPYAESRMQIGLDFLLDLTSRVSTSTAVVVFLQECVHSDLATIAKQPWVRDRFVLTDLDGGNWASGHYGTTILVDRRLPITALFRVHYEKTRMERDAFFVDVLMGTEKNRKVRICNTHLESLAMMPPYRPPQMQLVGRYLKEEGIHAGITAGDFNAIQDFDRTLHSDNGLKDAYLELGGIEDSDDGYTWGQQAATFLREKFGCSRMDKVYFHGGLQLESLERFGAGVLLQDKEQRKHLVRLGFEQPWITDHLGIKAELTIQE